MGFLACVDGVVRRLFPMNQLGLHLGGNKQDVYYCISRKCCDAGVRASAEERCYEPEFRSKTGGRLGSA